MNKVKTEFKIIEDENIDLKDLIIPFNDKPRESKIFNISKNALDNDDIKENIFLNFINLYLSYFIIYYFFFIILLLLFVKIIL